MLNHKTERIKKLHRKGMALEQIARKIGYGNPPTEEGLQRVRDALN